MALFVSCVASVATSMAQDPDWLNMSYTLHSEIQAVDNDGFAVFPMNAPVRMRGVILNRPVDMLDGRPGANPYMGGQWQIYVQAVEDDFGGTACWMGQNIGKITGTHPQGSYTDQEWLAEIDRLSHDPVSGRAFRIGDLIEIRARAPGMAYRGKSNINEQHSNDPAADYDLVLLQADYGLPAPAALTLADLKDVNDDFIFDPARLVGPEHYQGSLVRIDGVTFVDPEPWAPDANLTVTDGSGRTLTVLLGRGGGFEIYPAPAGTFDVVGILDQEDLDANNGYKDDYRLWVMNYNGNGTVIEGVGCQGDLTGDGRVTISDLAELLGHYGATGASYADGDFDRDGDVDLSDLAELLGVYGTSCW